MEIKNCKDKSCDAKLQRESGRVIVKCDKCSLETFTYTSDDLAILAWNNDKVFKFQGDEKVEELKVEEKVEDVIKTEPEVKPKRKGKGEQ